MGREIDVGSCCSTCGKLSERESKTPRNVSASVGILTSVEAGTKRAAAVCAWLDCAAVVPGFTMFDCLPVCTISSTCVLCPRGCADLLENSCGVAPLIERIFALMPWVAVVRRSDTSLPSLMGSSVCNDTSPLAVERTAFPRPSICAIFPRSTVPAGRAIMPGGTCVALPAPGLALTPFSSADLLLTVGGMMVGMDSSSVLHFILHEFDGDGSDIGCGRRLRRFLQHRALATDRIAHFIIFADNTK